MAMVQIPKLEFGIGIFLLLCLFVFDHVLRWAASA